MENFSKEELRRVIDQKKVELNKLELKCNLLSTRMRIFSFLSKDDSKDISKKVKYEKEKLRDGIIACLFILAIPVALFISTIFYNVLLIPALCTTPLALIPLIITIIEYKNSIRELKVKKSIKCEDEQDMRSYIEFCNMCEKLQMEIFMLEQKYSSMPYANSSLIMHKGEECVKMKEDQNKNENELNL